MEVYEQTCYELIRKCFYCHWKFIASPLFFLSPTVIHTGGGENTAMLCYIVFQYFRQTHRRKKTKQKTTTAPSPEQGVNCILHIVLLKWPPSKERLKSRGGQLLTHQHKFPQRHSREVQTKLVKTYSSHYEIRTTETEITLNSRLEDIHLWAY